MAEDEDRVEVFLDGLERLHSAALDFCQIEAVRIALVVIDELRSRPAMGTFGDDVAARHLWDEYCWALQEGPFDQEIVVANIHLGSLSDAFDSVVRSAILAEVEKLPQHVKVFLSTQALEEDSGLDYYEDENLGSIWLDGIADTILDAVQERAAQRNLDLIGPYPSFDIQGSGIAWSVLSNRGEAEDLVARHYGRLIDPDADLSQMAKEMVEAFVAAAHEDLKDTAFSVLLGRFGDEIRSLVLENDVLPCLKGMRAELLECLDG